MPPVGDKQNLEVGVGDDNFLEGDDRGNSKKRIVPMEVDNLSQSASEKVAGPTNRALLSP